MQNLVGTAVETPHNTGRQRREQRAKPPILTLLIAAPHEEVRASEDERSGPEDNEPGRLAQQENRADDAPERARVGKDVRLVHGAVRQGVVVERGAEERVEQTPTEPDQHQQRRAEDEPV
jgi:hypothetical protein